MIPQSSPGAGYAAHKRELDAAIAEVLESGWYILGESVRAFESEYAAAMSAGWCVSVANGTDALELALRALGIDAGSTVITVSHTAVATAAAIARIGARPLFVDVRADTMLMCPDSLREALRSDAGRRARALVVVHLYGQSAEMEDIVGIARQHGLAIVEDCAQAHGAAYRGRPVGTWGDAACYSFYPTKNLGAIGDGGAVTGSDSRLETAIRRLREYGWKTRYVSESLGFNSRLDELQAAILRVKLRHLEAGNARRREIAAAYTSALTGSAVRPPAVRDDATHVFHQYVVTCERRDALKAHLAGEGVGSLVHYPSAVHQQPAFADPALRAGSLAVTERVVDRILSLPMFPELQQEQVARVVASLGRFEAREPGE